MSHYALSGGKEEYFTAEGHEWPTLLAEIAQWMVDTNSAIDGLWFAEHADNDEGAYVCATVLHSSTYIQPCSDPFGENSQKLKVQFLQALINDLQETLDEVHN